MLLAARLTEGPAPRRGCTAHLTSEDLVTWSGSGAALDARKLLHPRMPRSLQDGRLVLPDLLRIQRRQPHALRHEQKPLRPLYHAAAGCLRHPSLLRRKVVFGRGKALFVRLDPATRDDETDFAASAGRAAWASTELYLSKTGSSPAASRDGRRLLEEGAHVLAFAGAEAGTPTRRLVQRPAPRCATHRKPRPAPSVSRRT